MILKKHLCGIAVAYEEPGTLRPEKKKVYNPYAVENEPRPQGSLAGWQKRKIADATEYLRKNSVYRPRIFVATTPGFLDHAHENKYISKLTHNLRNGYNCKNYVWVRELTAKGYPHWHFVADIPEFDPVSLSLWWSSLFGVAAKNSIRLGSKPDKKGKRKYWINSDKHAWYLTKYLTKSIGEKESEGRRKFRIFAVSQQLTKLSEPQAFTSVYDYEEREVLTTSGRMMVKIPTGIRHWQNCTAVMSDEDAAKGWNWKHTGHGETYIGLPKSWTLKQKK